MSTITPGPILDRAVAVAADPRCSVGMCASSGCIDIPASECDTPATDIDVLAVWKWKGERNWRTLPKFSTDLNAAFEAAEAAGLFPTTLCRPLNFWRALGVDELSETWPASEQDDEYYDTPALAICGAILKRRESRKYE